ncbi:MAG: hemolysin family protein [Planctomycetota bacterium]
MLGLADPLRPSWWVLGLALGTVLLAALEYGWHNLSRARLAESGGGPASRERVQKMTAEAHRVETALLVLRVAAQLCLVYALIMLARERVPLWWPDLPKSAPLLMALGAAFVWITLFCRVLPGELSRRVHEALVRATMPVVVLLGRLIAPPFDLCRKLMRIAFGTTRQAEAELYADEIRATVEEGEREGHLGGHQADIIERVLQLRELEVRRLMTPRTEVDTIDIGFTVGQAREIALATGRSRYPLVEDEVDHVVGVVHVKDLLRLPDDAPVSDARREPWFVPESKFITEMLAEFTNQKTHLAVVLDEYGGTAGVITIEDVLEEIVGDIDDEFDTDEEEEELVVVDERHAIALGTARVDELNNTLSINIPESDDWDTVGGYIFSTLGRLPEEGETLRQENLVLTVNSVVERRVEKVGIEILQPVS